MPSINAALLMALLAADVASVLADSGEVADRTDRAHRALGRRGHLDVVVRLPGAGGNRQEANE